MESPDLDGGVGRVSRQRVEESDACLEVLSRAHSTDVAMETAENERVAHARDSIASGLESGEASLGNLGHEVGVSSNLGHSTESFSCCTPQH